MGFKYEVIEPKLFAGAVADEVVASVLDVLSEKPRCSLSLAGGSTPVSVYRALTVQPREDEIPWDKLDLLFGDERWVADSDSQSNSRMVNENLIARLNVSKPKVFPVNTSLSSAELGAADYQKTIESLESARSKSGSVEIDLVLLGMGDDGHTASIFPNSPLLTQALEKQPLVAFEDWPNQPGHYRITMTPRLLMAARKILFLVQGANKAEMLAKALNSKEAASIPVHIFREVASKVTWFVDSEAARNL